jgi:hypothetical protein
LSLIGAPDWIPTPGAGRSYCHAVVPDGGGEADQALGDADGHSRPAASAVQLHVEPAFEGVVDRLDEQADRREQGLPRTGCPAAAGRAQQLGALPMQVVVELSGWVALVGDEQQPETGGRQMARGVAADGGWGYGGGPAGSERPVKDRTLKQLAAGWPPPLRGDPSR